MLGPDDWQTFRDIRLAALREAPYAFASSWENEKDHSEEDWRFGVTSRRRFVAFLDDRAAGMAAGGDSSYMGTAALTSLWVDPRARGHGIGDLLVAAVVEWAKGARFKRLLLWVTEGNSHAEALYRRNGFQRTGDVMHEPKREFEMARPL